MFSANPRITATIESPCASASDSRFKTTTPTPAPKTVPAASASKARQWPSARPHRAFLVEVAALLREGDRDAARQRGVAVVLQQRPARQADRDERGRAARLDVHARPLESQLVGDPRREKVVVVSEHRGISADLVGLGELLPESRRPVRGRRAGTCSCSCPPKTPMPPSNVSGLQPASSSARWQVSRKSRCCGSVSSASRGVNPKNDASKRSTSSSSPRALTYDGSGEQRRVDSRGEQLLVGQDGTSIPGRPSGSPRAARPTRRPGKRPAIPTIAIASASRLPASSWRGLRRGRRPEPGAGLGPAPATRATGLVRSPRRRRGSARASAPSGARRAP